MQQIANLLQNRQPPALAGPKFTNERQYIIQQIVDRINTERVGTKWKPVTWRQINGKVAHLKGFELNWFYSECCKRSSFSKFFFWSLKTQK